MKNLHHIKGFILDLDGTVYRGENLCPGADVAVQQLIAAGVGILYLSNNASDSRLTVKRKLLGLGLPVPDNAVVTGTSLLAAYVRAYGNSQPVLVIGEAGLREELTLADIAYEEAGKAGFFAPERYGAVVVGCDHAFSYRKLNQALQVLLCGGMLVATDADATYPTEHGVMPGTGAVLAGIERASGVRAIVAGKPSRYSALEASRMLSVRPDECLVVGDRLDSDIAVGTHLGASALVLSGVTSIELAAKASHMQLPEPDFIFPDLAAVVDAYLTACRAEAPRQIS